MKHKLYKKTIMAEGDLMELQIKLTKCLLILTEAELMRCLAKEPHIFKKAIGRGKAYKRCERAARYEKIRADWENEDINGNETERF